MENVDYNVVVNVVRDFEVDDGLCDEVINLIRKDGVEQAWSVDLSNLIP